MTLSKSVRPMVFRTLEGEPVVPSWLRRNSQRVLPAPFLPQNEAEPYHPPHEDEAEPEPFPQRGQAQYAQPPYAQPQPHGQQQPHAQQGMPLAQAAGGGFAPQMPPNFGARPPSMPPPGPNAPRRPSLPPRFSAPPPQVMISRPPPRAESLPPAPPAPEPITPAEVEQFALAALELGSLRARILLQAETQVLELAVAIAEAIIERQVELDPAIHETLARAAVAVLGDTSTAKLRVSRAAYKVISELHGEPAVDVEGVRVEMSIDNSLDGLSVVAESGASRVDGRLSERLGAVLRAIEAEHRRKDAGEEE
ncbi:MAG: FliH/SctL family protein [Polyangiales bacterium]